MTQKLWLGLMISCGVATISYAPYRFDDLGGGMICGSGEYDSGYNEYDHLKRIFVASINARLAQGKTGAQLDEPINHWWGYSPLRCTEIYGEYPDIIEKLIKAGADVNAKNGEPLKAAINHGHCRTVKLLLEYGAHIATLPDKETSALGMCMMHAYKDRLAKVQLLLQYGADVNAWDKLGYTPLMHAVNDTLNFAGDTQACIKFLLAHGANPCIKGNNKQYRAYGKNGIDLARQEGNEKLASYLQEVPTLRKNIIMAILMRETPVKLNKDVANLIADLSYE
jgi:hypothetical protein